jgi:peroxiredoxin
LDSLSAIGDSAPLFTLPDRYGGLYRLSEMRGKIVLLVFWSPECDWCQRTDNALVAALPDWGARVHVLWIASNHGEPLDRLAQVAEQRGLSLVLLDTGQQVADSYRAQVTPHVFVIDAGGIASAPPPALTLPRRSKRCCKASSLILQIHQRMVAP